MRSIRLCYKNARSVTSGQSVRSLTPCAPQFRLRGRVPGSACRNDRSLCGHGRTAGIPEPAAACWSHTPSALLEPIVQRFRSVRSAVDALKGNHDPAIRVAAATFLGQFKDRASYMALLEAIDFRSYSKTFDAPDYQVRKELMFAAHEALRRRPDATMRNEIAWKQQQTAKRLTERLQEELLYPDRREILEKLGDFRDNRSYKALVGALDDNEHSVAAAAAAAAAKRRQFRATRPLTERLHRALREKDYSRFELFIEALGDIGDPRAVAVLIECLGHAKLMDDIHREELARLKARVRDGPLLRPAIAKAIAKLGNAAVAPLIHALDHPKSEVRDGVVSALTLLAPAAAESLIQTLRSGTPVTRFGAAVALGGADSEEVCAALIAAATRDVELPVAAAAARSLGRSRCPEALVVLEDLTTRSDTLVRVAAAAALGQLGVAGAAAPLAMMLGDTDREVRQQAERSLARVGSYAIGAMEQLLGHENAGVADAAARVLGATGAAALEPLLDNLAATDTRRRRSAAVGLGRICGVSYEEYHSFDPSNLARGITALQTTLGDKHANVRCAAAEALGKLSRVADLVADFLADSKLDPVGAVELQMMTKATESSISRLVQALDDPISGVRASCAAALGTIGRHCSDALLDMLRRPTEPARIAAAEALMLVDDQNDAADIVTALSDPNPAVRQVVAIAISRYVAKAEFPLAPITRSTGITGAFYPGRRGGHGWFKLSKDYFQVYIGDAVSQIIAALARLAQEDRDLQIRSSALEALEGIRRAIQEKRDHGERDVHYMISDDAPPSALDIETEQELLAGNAVAAAIMREEPARFTDLSFYEGHLFPGDESSTAQRVPDEESLQAGREYTLEAAIRRERSGIAASIPAVRAVLNPRQTTETLKIFVVARLLGPTTVAVDEPVAVINWPYDADSSPAFFRLAMPNTLAEPEEATIQVRFYHGNLDLLDVVNLSFFVSPDGEETNVPPARIDWPRLSKAEPRLDPDTTIRKLTIHIGRALDGGYDLDFIFLRKDGTVSLPSERHVTPGDLEDLLTKVRDFWTELVITNYENRLSVTLTTWNRYLVRLNELGTEAWELLFGSRAGSQKGASEIIGDLLAGMDLAAGTHVQITCDRGITDFVFPWSILYSPTNPSITIDPYLFWGAKYQIEQVWEGGSQDGLEVEPIGIAVVADPGFGEAQAEIDMFESFKANADGRLDIDAPITNRQGLLMTLAGPPSRHFYYFFCHGYAPAGTPVMRRDGVKLLRESIEALPPPERKPWDSLLALTANMADEAWMFIGSAQITESELRRARNFFNQRRPILFLNMCHSAALAPSMTRGLLRLFLDRDAAAVIGTESPMTSVFAHAFAYELLKRLFSGSDLGTALWHARRHFLAGDLRNPLGFAYTLYGRATARLGTGPLMSNKFGG
jgi:HEAT repeat protein